MPDPSIVPGRWLRPNLREAQDQLRRALTANVAIIEKRGKGHIRIPFADHYDFERLFATLTGKKLEIAYRPSRSE